MVAPAKFREMTVRERIEEGVGGARKILGTEHDHGGMGDASECCLVEWVVLPPYEGGESLPVLVGLGCIAGERLGVHVAGVCFSGHSLGNALGLGLVAFEQVPADSGHDQTAEALGGDCGHTEQGSCPHGEADAIDLTVWEARDQLLLHAVVRRWVMVLGRRPVSG